MPFSSDRYQFAHENARNVFLRQLVGAFELVFGITGTVHQQDPVSHWLVVHSARISVSTKSGNKDLGTAFPNLPTEIRQYSNPGYFSLELKLRLSSSQLAALEAHRDAGDVNFGVVVWGISGKGEVQNQSPEQETIYVQVPQSEWIATLKGANAADILLLEVPLSLVEANRREDAVSSHLRRAQDHFLGRHWLECVTECRKAAEELERSGLPSIWPMLASQTDREAMSKDDRQRAVLATIKHYTHPSAHSAARGGSLDYTRSEAKLALSLVAAMAAH